MLGQEYDFLPLQKIKEGLAREQACERNLAQLNSILQSPSVNLQQIFANYDQNENNNLELGEFGKIIKTINTQVSDEDIKYIFIKVDVDCNNHISFREFKQIASQQAGAPSPSGNRPEMEDRFMRPFITQLQR